MKHDDECARFDEDFDRMRDYLKLLEKKERNQSEEKNAFLFPHTTVF